MRLMKRAPPIITLFALGHAPPLHMAANFGNLGAVDMLLKRGADANSRNQSWLLIDSTICSGGMFLT